MKEYIFLDSTDLYQSVMQFDKNKNVFVHRWYPFVEGYSKEFIDGILNELDFTPQCVLEPFCGSGTTPVELQSKGIKCFSFEVSPFMFLLAQTKLCHSYKVCELNMYINDINKGLKECPKEIRDYVSLPFGSTVVQSIKRQKFNFHDSAIDGLLDIRYTIDNVINNIKYKNLCYIALASIIMETSNLFRNGKCLSYKSVWENKVPSRDYVHELFINKLITVMLEDVAIIEKQTYNMSNEQFCFYGDVRKKINIINDRTVDLIITSPPYLNSRDYTDIYMLELKVLGLIKNYDELRKLRYNTVRSHVQIRYKNVEPISNERLTDCLRQMQSQEDSVIWNGDIYNMICGYFADMQNLFYSFRRVMKHGGRIYFNVANSAYFGVEVPVDLIISDIAEHCGFNVIEIRKARDLKTSPQQKGKVGKLRESIIVIGS